MDDESNRFLTPSFEPEQDPSGVVNDHLELLTYETFFNQRPYRKSNQRFEMGLFTIPLSKVSVYILSGIEQGALATLLAAFFPEVPMEAVLQHCWSTCPWKDSRSPLCISSDELGISRSTLTLHTDPDVVMPYNFEDNESESRAIGTRDVSLGRNKITRLNATWHMWKTASRSCIVDVRPVTDLSERGGFWPWMGGSKVDIDVVAKGTTAFRIGQMKPTCFSIKCGVTHVGERLMYQKDTLQLDVYYGGLQSEYINALNKLRIWDNARDSSVCVMLELLGICEGAFTSKSDGMLLRDLSCLKPDHLYVCPISIPFLGLDGIKLRKRFAAVTDTVWCDFWKEHYARKLGRAKALLLTRYGLVLATPNAQNFLIECSPGTSLQPTGRIFIRDIGDAQPRMDLVWALLKKPMAMSVAEEAFPDVLFFRLHEFLTKHELEAKRFGPHWHDFSTLSKALGITTESSMLSIDPDVRSRGWQRVFFVMAEWGLAHTRAWLEVIANATPSSQHLLPWMLLEKYPDPTRFLALRDDDYEGAEQLYGEYQNWEEDVGAAVLKYLSNEDILSQMRQMRWESMDTLFEPSSSQPTTSGLQVSSHNVTSKSYDINTDPAFNNSEWSDDESSSQ